MSFKEMNDIQPKLFEYTKNTYTNWSTYIDLINTV